MHFRPYLLLTILLGLGGCATVPENHSEYISGKIGQTEAQITKELGPPTYHYINGFNLFHDNSGNEVQAHYDGGKADAVFYFTFSRKISEPWLSSVLNLNSGRRPWVLEASSTSGRKIYRTSDGNLHASVSRGNQLMVMTDRFFRNVLHPKSQSVIPIDELPECLFAPDHPEALIRMKEATIVKNFGQEVCTLKDGAKAYSDGYQCPIVHYKNGISDSVFCSLQGSRKMTQCWISRALGENSGGDAWIVAGCSKPGYVIYWTPNSDLVASFYKDRYLQIYTQQRGKDLQKSLGEKALKNPYFKASFTPCAPVFIGQTESYMTKKLGKPKIEGANRIYHDGDLRIRACFEHGICNKIIYSSEKKRKFTDHWVSSTLAVNARGRAWLVREGSKSKATFYNTYDEKLYARLLEGNQLGILTEKLLNQSMQKINAEKLKAQKSVPSKS